MVRDGAFPDRDALQLVLASVFEGQSTPDDEVPHGLRDEHLRRLGERTDAGPDRDGDPRDVGAVELDLTGVEPATDLDPERGHRVPDRAGASVGDGAVAVPCEVRPGHPRILPREETPM